MTTTEDLGAKMAAAAVDAMSPRVLAAARALCRAENIPWDAIDIRQQYTFCCDAMAALDAADTVGGPEVRKALRSEPWFDNLVTEEAQRYHDGGNCRRCPEELRLLQRAFDPENVARVVAATGISLQTVTEVVRELRRG